MLDLNFEILNPLSAQEKYDIINYALTAANDNGFLSQFVYEAALWGRTAAILVDDVPEEIIELLDRNPIAAYDRMVKEEIIAELFKKYQNDVINGVSVLDYFGNIAALYFSDYKDYLLSLGGALSQTDMMSSNNLDTFTKSLQDFMQSDNTLKTLNLADSWGKNNEIAKLPIQEKQKEQIKNSLFN